MSCCKTEPRALTAAGKWDYAAWHDDTPQRTFEARQSRIVASIHQGDPETGLLLVPSGLWNPAPQAAGACVQNSSVA